MFAISSSEQSTVERGLWRCDAGRFLTLVEALENGTRPRISSRASSTFYAQRLRYAFPGHGGLIFRPCFHELAGTETCFAWERKRHEDRAISLTQI